MQEARSCRSISQVAIFLTSDNLLFLGVTVTVLGLFIVAIVFLSAGVFTFTLAGGIIFLVKLDILGRNVNISWDKQRAAAISACRINIYQQKVLPNALHTQDLPRALVSAAHNIADDIVPGNRPG